MKSSLGTFQPAKGLLMLMIVSSHTASVFWPVPRTSSQAAPALTALQLLSDLLRYAAMPCFFMICGYGFRRRRLPILMRNTVAPIAKAYLITSLLIIGIAAIRAVAEGQGVVRTLVVQSLTYALMATPPLELLGLTTRSIGTIWFPCVAALASIVLNQVLALRERRWQAVVCAALACAGVLLRALRLPFCILQTCVCVSYMYVGYLMRREKLRHRARHPYQWGLNHLGRLREPPGVCGCVRNGASARRQPHIHARDACGWHRCHLQQRGGEGRGDRRFMRRGLTD